MSELDEAVNRAKFWKAFGITAMVCMVFVDPLAERFWHGPTCTVEAGEQTLRLQGKYAHAWCAALSPVAKRVSEAS